MKVEKVNAARSGKPNNFIEKYEKISRLERQNWPYLQTCQHKCSLNSVT